MGGRGPQHERALFGYCANNHRCRSSFAFNYVSLGAPRSTVVMNLVCKQVQLLGTMKIEEVE
jgi:hypothetical protein